MQWFNFSKIGIQSSSSDPSEQPRDQHPAMSQSSIPSTSQPLTESSAPRSSSPDSRPDQGYRNRDLLSRDERHNTAVTTNHDDYSRQRFEHYYARYKHYRSEFSTCRDQCAELKKMLDDKEQEVHLHEKEARRRERQVAELMDELTRLRERESRGREELTMAEMRQEETKRLLKTKVEELEGMQAFTRKADEVSVADVIDLVKALNAEILQAAAFISDHFSSFHEQASHQDVSKAIKVVQDSLGEEVAEAVQSLGEWKNELDPEDPTAVQLALQIAMTASCEKMISDWTLVRDSNDWFNDIYDRIRATEPQAIAGRWRALTRAQVGAKDSSHVIKHLIYYLVNVLIAIGSQVHADVFCEAFQGHLTAIADNIIRIQTAAGVSVTSVDVVPYFFPPGMDFMKEFMSDMYGPDGTGDTTRDVILGTTGLGLLQREKQTDAAGQSSDQPVALLKAKVVLESALRE